MRRYLASIVRAFFVSGAGIGGGIALLVFIGMLVLKHRSAFLFSLIVGFSIGAAFGMFMLAVFLPLDIGRKLFRSRGGHRDLWEIDQVQEMEFRGSSRDAIILARQALVALPHARRVNEDTDNTLVLATIGRSWRSSGELMEVKIVPLSDNICRLVCRSSPISSTTVFDYGKNFDNVLTFTKNFARLAVDRAAHA